MTHQKKDPGRDRAPARHTNLGHPNGTTSRDGENQFIGDGVTQRSGILTETGPIAGEPGARPTQLRGPPSITRVKRLARNNDIVTAPSTAADPLPAGAVSASTKARSGGREWRAKRTPNAQRHQRGQPAAQRTVPRNIPIPIASRRRTNRHLRGMVGPLPRWRPSQARNLPAAARASRGGGPRLAGGLSSFLPRIGKSL